MGNDGIAGGIRWALDRLGEWNALYSGLIALAVLTALMIRAGLAAYRSWEEATEDLDPATNDELLEAFRQARMDGELDEGEFERARRLIEERKPPG